MRTLSACIALALAVPCFAQEALNTESATQPAPNTVYVKPQFRYWRFGVGANPTPSTSPNAPGVGTQGVSRAEPSMAVQMGLVKDVSFSLKVPMIIEDRTFPADRDLSFALGRVDAQFKLRVYRSDTSSLDTIRAVIYAGALMPSGDDNVAPQTVDPYAGFSAMIIRDRIGITQSIRYTITTSGGSWEYKNLGGDGPADALKYDTALMYRLAPSAFTAENSGEAWYASLEVNGLYETNGDNEILLSPGLLYEAQRFAAEFSVGLPVVQDVRHRPPLEFQFSAGLRFVF